MIKIVTLTLIIIAVAGGAWADVFFLEHVASGRRLGPYEFTDANEIEVANASFTVQRETHTTTNFHLRHHGTNRVLGPFKLEEAAIIELGSNEFKLLLVEQEPVSSVDEENHGNRSGYPGLPQLDTANLLVIDPRIRNAMLSASEFAARNAALSEHLAAIDNTLLQVTEVPSPMQRPNAYSNLIRQESLLMLLLQSAVIRSVGVRSLEHLAASNENADFVPWLLTHNGAMEELLLTMQPQDDLTAALRIWARLWNKDPAHRDEYFSLALACALVYDSDQPRRRGSNDERLSPDEIYRNFRDADLAGRLRTNLNQMPAADLVWVVDLEISADEIEWARRNVRLTRRQWGRSYGMVEYLMERAVDRVNPYTEYTLAEILEKGGICTDQAHFAAMSAKANGIPAMVIIGTGRRGGHAWFGYKEDDRNWNIESGRYTYDDYVAGTTRMAQTGRALNEHEIRALTDPQTRTRGHAQATELTWLARIFQENQRYTEAMTALEMAMESSRRHVPAWNLYFECLEATDAPLEQWSATIASRRRAFASFPDAVAEIDKREAELVREKKGAQAAADTIARQLQSLSRESRERTDLIMERLRTQVTMLDGAGEKASSERAFQRAMDEWGDHPSSFRELSQTYANWAERSDRLESAANHIRRVFSRQYRRPHGDYFALNNYRELLQIVLQITRRAGNENEVRRLERDLEDINRHIERNYRQSQ